MKPYEKSKLVKIAIGLASITAMVTTLGWIYQTQYLGDGVEAGGRRLTTAGSPDLPSRAVPSQPGSSQPLPGGERFDQAFGDDGSGQGNFANPRQSPQFSARARTRHSRG